MNRIPITKAKQLKELNSAEIIDGYFDGLDNLPEPGDNRSFSYWHGWRNGMIDGHHLPPDDACRALAKDVVDSGYLRNGMEADAEDQ